MAGQTREKWLRKRATVFVGRGGQSEYPILGHAFFSIQCFHIQTHVETGSSTDELTIPQCGGRNRKLAIPVAPTELYIRLLGRYKQAGGGFGTATSTARRIYTIVQSREHRMKFSSVLCDLLMFALVGLEPLIPRRERGLSSKPA